MHACMHANTQNFYVPNWQPSDDSNRAKFMYHPSVVLQLALLDNKYGIFKL